MPGSRERADLAETKSGETRIEASTDRDERGLSSGLFSSLSLILIGASIGVFWREIFHLTIRAIEAFR